MSLRPRVCARQSGRVRWGLLASLAALVLLALLAWAWRAALRGGAGYATPAPAAGTGAQAAVASAMRQAPDPASAAAPFSAQGLALRQQERQAAQARLARAQEALAAYTQAARYPHGSRPIAEHPDQVRPFAPIEEDHGLRTPGGAAPTQGVRLRTTQERVFAAGRERNRISLTLLDSQGRPLPLRITQALMREVAQPGRPASPVAFALAVNDAGQDGDAVAGDGVFTGVMQPATQGFAGVSGLIRLSLDLDYAGQPGFLYFDLIYSPETAAQWLPGVREVLEAGTLQFVLPVDVKLPGRYLVSGRVDDANGRPFALASFNDEVAAGSQAFKLPVNGRLVHDQMPALPLQLRDVEAFLLKPDTYPDRVMLPRLAGLVHRSAVTRLAQFSDAPWTSEERERYLAELSKDVDAAQAQVDRLGP